MPYSESIGFNADTNDPDKIDWTTYVVAMRWRTNIGRTR